MVSLLDSGSNGLESSPGRGHCFTLTVPWELSEEPYEMLGGNLRWTSIPFWRNNNTSSGFMLRKLEFVPVVWATCSCADFTHRVSLIFSFLVLSLLR